ncbi:MAG: ATP-binding cassette domain-containing protein [Anaerolineaceae bacterium]|nr:MAG: ATP-binding cassette domain-containing protein [Anaerolineaceae bacterium]
MPIIKPLVGVVGPCGSGKSTLIAALEERGYKCRHIAQEHSYVKDMWKRISNPDVLIFLQASFPVCTARRQLNWGKSDHAEQQRRLTHALQHANLVVETDTLSPAEVATRVLDFLEKL